MRFCFQVAVALMFSFLWLESASPQSNGLGKYTISALKIEINSVKLDGILDEPEWQRTEAITEFIQCEPTFGISLSEKTTVRILYDNENIYVGAVCYYQDIKDLVAAKLAHRDIGSEDQIAFVLDTFRDRTKAYCFMTNYGVLIVTQIHV